MKDYLTDKEDLYMKRDFILNYEAEDDCVTIYFANGNILKKSLKMNKKQTLEDLNLLMKEQVRVLNQSKKGDRLKKSFYKKGESTIAFFTASTSILGISSILSGVPSSVLTAMTVIFGSVFVSQLVGTIKAKRLSDDFEKNATFIEKEEYINDELNNQPSENINLNVSKKNQKFINENEYKIDIYNLNDIKLKELKELLNYFQRNKELEQVIEKNKVLKK